jgi:nucleoside-diphosphate-sugar epimerase
MGGKGRLGSAICKSVGSGELNLLSRFVYEDWWKVDSLNSIKQHFEKNTGESDVVVVATGKIDPAVHEREHLDVNYHLPRNVIQAVTDLGLRVVTFGTVSEYFQSELNSYIRSKKMLTNFINTNYSTDHGVIHIRLHTLYGGPQPNEFMFLGHVLKSLQSRELMKMTSGLQLREYHHVDDVGAAVVAVLNSPFLGVHDLNHGFPLTLRDLAIYLFDRFDARDLLSLGSLQDPVAENYENVFVQSEFYQKPDIRPPLQAIGDYIETYLGEKGEEFHV